MITIDFKEFAWNLASEISSIAYDEVYRVLGEADYDQDEYVKRSVIDMQAREAWCEVEDILEAIRIKEEAWQERIQREDLEPPSHHCDCGVCYAYEENY